MVKGKLRFLPLKGGGITITVDVPEGADVNAIIPELAQMFGKEVAIRPADEAVSEEVHIISELHAIGSILDGLSDRLRGLESVFLEDGGMMSEEEAEELQAKVHEQEVGIASASYEPEADPELTAGQGLGF